MRKLLHFSRIIYARFFRACDLDAGYLKKCFWKTHRLVKLLIELR